MPDYRFQHFKGLITKSEIRSIVIAKLQLTRKDHIFWDVGAGSGSVSIEVAHLIPRGQVTAIEKNPGRIKDIYANMATFNKRNIQVINQPFPFEDPVLPPPDRIFVGGGGQDLEAIITHGCERLEPRGIMVVNTVLLQNMILSMDLLQERGFEPELLQVMVSKSTAMPFGERLSPLNPVWILSGRKPLTKVTDT
jgi:precorrin-6Y C5,15-methyltransferase (decarboxylating)